jgi:HSP20 family molecular chaperone IbpA
MSALTRRNGRALTDLFEWFEAPYALLHPFPAHAMPTEEGVENDRYVVRAEVPGIDPEKDAKVTVANGILTIHADRQEATEARHRSEFRYGSFTRHVTLPASADESDIEASYDKGILEVSVALTEKDETGRNGRRIPVRLVQHIKPT